MTQKTMKDTKDNERHKVHGNLNRKQNSRPFHVEKIIITVIDKLL